MGFFEQRGLSRLKGLRLIDVFDRSQSALCGKYKAPYPCGAFEKLFRGFETNGVKNVLDR